MSKLYTVGPVEMYPRTLEIGGKQIPYFRTAEFSEIMLSATTSLKRLVDSGEDSEVVVLTASGTAAMEATVMNCFTKYDRLLVINGGTFGQRFVQICDIHEIPYKALEVPKGQALTEEMLLAAIENEEFTGLLVNIHETSTGQLYNLQMLSDYCKKNNWCFVVDAISSFLADEISVDKYGIDAMIMSSQKALSLAPGLGIVVLSKKMIETRVNKIDSHSLYLDFKSHIENGKRGQTPFTPAVRVIIELEDMVKMLEEKGIDNVIAHTALLAADFRARIKEIGLTYPDYPLSNAVTPVHFENGKAQEVYQILKDEYGMVVNPSGGEAAKYAFRVGHIGNHSIADNELLVNAIKEILNNGRI